MNKRARPNSVGLGEVQLKYKDADGLKNEWMGQGVPQKQHMKVEMAVLISNKSDFKKKSIARGKN